MQDSVPYVVDGRAHAAGVVLMQCPLAGFQFYAAESHWRQLRARDPLTLAREPGNRHDPRAVRIEWQGLVLGYVPREANYTLSQMLDRGHEISGRIVALQESPDPWKRVMVEIEWLGDPSRTARPPGGRPSDHSLEDVTLVDLGSFVIGAPPSKIDFARAVEGLSDGQRGLGAVTLARSGAEIIGRLAMPVTGVVTPASRSVQLWGLIEITISTDGRSLSGHWQDTKKRISLSANLATPIGNVAWTGPFEGIVDRSAPHVGWDVIIASLPKHWLERSLRRSFNGFIDFAAMRRAALDFLAPDELTRSLANRVFDGAPTADQFNWCGRHRDALCLTAIEHPALLPFLRWAEADKRFRDTAPMAALSTLLSLEGMDEGTAKRLERWSYDPFLRFAQDLIGEESLEMLVAFANLLARLDVTERPPAFFCHCAGAAASWFYPQHDCPVFGTRVPDWFMRAMLREIERMEDEEDEIGFGEQVMTALPWIASMPPEPDANQCKAGWPWIMERVREFEIRQARGEWQVPLGECAIGGYRIVPIRKLAQLKSEAQEMKNCLENYADQCKAGVIAIFSIRTTGLGAGKRVADVAAVRVMRDGRAVWALHQVAGKMNAAVSCEVEAAARGVVEALNSTKGAKP